LFPAQGQDLDNIFRQLAVPVLLETCHFRRVRRHPYAILADIASAAAQSNFALVEGVALNGVPRPQGTLVIALSDGQRHKSWWQLTLDRDRRSGAY
jgi:hypothetical protein